MSRPKWKAAAAIGLAAVVIALAAAFVVTRRDPSPQGVLPGPDAESAPPVTVTPKPTPEPTPEPTPIPPPDKVTFVGDSIMVAAQYDLRDLVPDCIINAQVGRYLIEGLDAMYGMAAAGQIYDTVVVGLGSNGPFELEEGEEVMDLLGPDRTVYWVTCYGRYLSWQDEVNDVIRQLEEEYDNLTIIDWSSVAPQHPEWISTADGIHLTREGATGYARFVAESIGVPIPEEGEETPEETK